MKIDAIDVYRVHMPLVYPFRTAFGNDESIESILVRLRSGDAFGWGESSPWRMPAYSAECAAGCLLFIREFLAPLILEQDVSSGEQLQTLLAPVKRNEFAKAALDLAWWDLHARQCGQPLWQVLGGTRTEVEVGADFGIMETIDDLVRTVGDALDAGFKRVKLKYRPGWELNMICRVREAFPEAVLHVDCNSAYTLDDIDMLRELDQYGLAMIEQPLMHDDLIDHATLQKQLRTPVCLDESITSAAKARKAIAAGACGWVNIKPSRVGGLTSAVAVHNVCQDAGIPCWVGGMLESSVGAHHCLALATLPNFKYPSDIFPTERFYSQDLSDPPVLLSSPSVITAPDKPGCGAEPNAERLAVQTIESEHLRR